MTGQHIVISGAIRTPIGSLLGSLSSVGATELGATVVRECVARAALEGETVDKVFMGCVLTAGLGQAPARQATLGAGMPRSVQATTINKMCGSGMQAVIFAHNVIAAGEASVIVAGGMESMSRTPFLLPNQRVGIKFGHGEIVDHMLLDGLEDAYDPGCLMGVFADRSSLEHGIGRAELDDFAALSLSRAQSAAATGTSRREIVPVKVTTPKGTSDVALDEQPQRVDKSKISTLKPAFSPEGPTTAASSSSMSDGAASMVVARERSLTKSGVVPITRFVGHSSYAAAPSAFCEAPSHAIGRLLQKVGWAVQDVDLFEINEAFAVVPLIAARHLNLDLERLNTRGGACALGHPIGASGARILATLIDSLAQRGGGRGVASICLAGGEALAIAVETA